jgi:glutamyl/glutaminyl-tRNA synthetase
MRPDLDALAAHLPPSPLTRFAPSPTGHLHLGHVVNAIYVWGIARALGGRVLLRIEDHDRARSRLEYERSILEDLDWLGLEPDIGSFNEFRTGSTPYRQSDASETYAAALTRVRAVAPVYPCTCSRKTIAAVAPASPMHETPYPGTCRSRPLVEHDRCALRVRVEPGVETFVDALLGPQCQEPAQQCGDLLVRDRDGFWTYQFSVVVDDARQEVDLVIRGRDLLESTGRQIRLARMLGRSAPPVYLHHPLVLKPSGDKLSKSSRDTGVRDLRAAGVPAERVLGLAAHACGLQEAPAPVTARDLPRLFENRRRHAAHRGLSNPAAP